MKVTETRKKRTHTVLPYFSRIRNQPGCHIDHRPIGSKVQKIIRYSSAEQIFVETDSRNGDAMNGLGTAW